MVEVAEAEAEAEVEVEMELADVSETKDQRCAICNKHGKDLLD